MLTPTIIDYDILIYPGRRDIVIAVSNAIKRGWQPLGPVVKDNNNSDYYQTMVKYEQPKLNKL